MTTDLANANPTKPCLALALGDAAGIGAELAARVLGDPEVREAARFVVIGDRRQLDQGARQAEVDVAIEDFDPAVDQDDCLVDLGNLDPSNVSIGEASPATGAAALENFAFALRLCDAGGAGATCFTPFNKHAMRLASDTYVDEIGFIKTTLNSETTGSEFNVLDEIWNARVHVPHPLERSRRQDH